MYLFKAWKWFCSHWGCSRSCLTPKAGRISTFASSSKQQRRKSQRGFQIRTNELHTSRPMILTRDCNCTCRFGFENRENLLHVTPILLDLTSLPWEFTVTMPYLLAQPHTSQSPSLLKIPAKLQCRYHKPQEKCSTIENII